MTDKFEEACRSIQSHLVTERKKGLEALPNYTSDPTVQSRIDAKTDSKSKHLSWSVLLGWVHDAIVSNIAKFKPLDPIRKAKGITSTYSSLIKHADARGERIKATDVVSSHVMHVLANKNLCRFVGKDYIRILSKHILSSAHHCASVSQAKWMNLLHELMTVQASGMLPPTLLISSVFLLLSGTSVRSLLHDRLIFLFYTDFIRQEWNRHYEKNATFVLAVVQLGTLYSTQVIETSQEPGIVLELGALLIPLLLRPNHSLLFKGTKGEVMEFVSIVLSVWQALDSDERTVSLEEVIRSLYSCVMTDLEDTTFNPFTASTVTSVESTYYTMCGRILLCKKDMQEEEEEPARWKRRTATLPSLFLEHRTDVQKVAMCKVSEYLIYEGYFTADEGRDVALCVLKWLKESKSIRNTAEACLGLLFAAITGSSDADLRSDIADTVLRTCLVYQEYLSLKILARCDTIVDITSFKKPTWANIEYIQQKLNKFQVDDKRLLNWLLRGVWKHNTLTLYKTSAADWRGKTSTTIGEVLARVLVGKKTPVPGSAMPPGVNMTPGAENYAVLQFKENKSLSRQQHSHSAPDDAVSLNKDLVGTLKAIFLEICMKLSTTVNQDHLLLLYGTVLQSLLTELEKLGVPAPQRDHLAQQFDFMVVYVKGITMTADLYPVVLELARVATVDVPTSWTLHFQSAIKGVDSPQSSLLDSEESMFWGKENTVPEMMEVTSTLLPSTGSTQCMANEEELFLCSQQADQASERKNQIVGILVAWCRSAPDSTVNILNFLQALCYEYYGDRAWASCILNILRQLASLTPTLPTRYVEMLPEVARLLLSQYHKDEWKCSDVLQSVAVLLRHASSQHYNAIDAVLQNIVLPFWALYTKNKLARECRAPFLSCVQQVLALPAAEVLSPLEVLRSMLCDDVPAIRVQVIGALGALLETSPVRQMELFEMFSSGYEQALEEALSLEEEAAPLSSLSRSYLLFLSRCSAKTVLQLPALEKVLLLAPRAPDACYKATCNISSSLLYSSPSELLRVFREQLFRRWFGEGRATATFPYRLFGYQTLVQFYREHSAALCLSLMLHDQYSELPLLYQTLGQTPKEVLMSGASLCYLLAAVLPLLNTGLKTDEVTGKAAYEYLVGQVGNKTSNLVLKAQIDEVVTAVVLRTHGRTDPQYAKYLGGDSVTRQHPVFATATTRACITFVRTQMKDSKKPGLFKLLALSEAGVHGVLINIYTSWHAAKSSSLKLSLLVCYKFLLDMLLEDEHNSLTSERVEEDWSLLATSIVTSLTHVLAAPPTETSLTHVLAAPPTETRLCCDMLLALLGALPLPYTLLGASVTYLIRRLAVLSQQQEVEELLKLLLADCHSPSLLPVVHFNCPATDAIYKHYTSLPVNKQDMLTTVRSIEGAYWYLANMTSAVTSSDELMTQNTALKTLLESDDKHSRLLLGRLSHISELDIALINNIHMTGIRSWSSITEDIPHYIAIITDVLTRCHGDATTRCQGDATTRFQGDATTPYIYDVSPAVQRCVHRVLRNILRSNAGRAFKSCCASEDLLLLLPFTVSGTAEKAPSRTALCSGLSDPALLRACSCDAIRYLAPLAALKPCLLDKVLGVVLHDLLTSDPGTRQQLSELFMGDVEELPQLKHLQAIKYLSEKPVDKSGVRYNNYSWLQLDWLAMSRAAIRLGQYTTALLYLELHVEGVDEKKQLSRLRARTAAADTQEVLLEVYLHLQCSDALYGTQCNSSSSKLKVYSFQQRWYDLLSYSDLATSREHLITALKHTSPAELLPLLLAGEGVPGEDHYEAAWRNSSWEQLEERGEGLHGNIYSSLLNIRNNKTSKAVYHVERAQKECRSLKPQQHFVYIQLLNEISNFATLEKRHTTPDLDYRKWEVLYQCRAVLSELSQESPARLAGTPAADTHTVLLECARAARINGQFHAANRFLKRGLDLGNTLALKTEECKLEWASGERRRALHLLETLLDEGTPSYPELLITKAGWLAETNAEFPSYILGNCLEAAVSWCQDHADTATLGEAHLKLALFADEQLKARDQYFASSEYRDDMNVVQNTRKDLQVLKGKSIRSQTHAERKQGVLLQMQVRQDEEKMKKRGEERTNYLVTTLQNYISSLKRDSVNVGGDLHVFRLFSLLLDNSDIDEVSELAISQVPHIPSYKLLPPIYQLSARLGSAGSLDNLLVHLITKAAEEHPYHVLPVLFALKNAHLDCSKPLKQEEARTLFARSIIQALRTKTALKEMIGDMEKLTEAYVEWANYPIKEDPSFGPALPLNKLLKIPRSLKITKLRDMPSFPAMTLDIPVRPGGKYSANFPTVVGFKSEFKTPGGVNVPKLTFVLCSDGVTRKQLVKGNDDLRQDMVMEQVFDVANQLLRKNATTRDLHMVTYKVMPLSQRSGLLQWCEKTVPLGDYLVGDRSKGGAHAKYRPKDALSCEVRQVMKTCQNNNPRKLPEVYRRQCELFKPVFRHYFTEEFSNPAEWYKQKCNYAHSLATSSIVGHIVGLGDRHVKNILISQETSELIHIDLGVAFDQGQLLSIPEKVPFRLTRDLVDALGISGTEGVFRRSCEHVMRELHANKALIIAIIEVFIHDPLHSWCVEDTTKADSAKSPDTEPESDNNQAQRVLTTLKRKLEGIEEGVVLGLEGQINHLIRKAQDPANLSRIFVGWQPWI